MKTFKYKSILSDYYTSHIESRIKKSYKLFIKLL